MLIIRNEQMRALFFGLAGKFRTAAREHLRTRHPSKYAEMDELEVERTIQLALEKAWRYGIEDDEDILRYFDVMLIAGARFDEDPRYAWAREMLQDKAFAPETRAEYVQQRMHAERNTSQSGAHG